MSGNVKLLVLLLAFSLTSLPALAQDTSTGDETAETGAAETEGTTEEAESPPELPLGTPVDGDGIGQTYVKESFSDWDLRCIRTESGKDPCQLYQLLRDGSDNPVAEMTIFTVAGSGEAVAGANIITPLETLLTANLRMAVDRGPAKAYPFAFCRQVGCFVRLGLTADEISQFQKGVAANVVIVPAAAPDQTVALSASLSGFTAGWKALVDANKAVAEE